MKTKKRAPRKIFDYYTDPCKPLWPHFAGMLLPFAVCGVGIYFGLISFCAGIDSEATDGTVVLVKTEIDRDGTRYGLAIVEYTVGEKKYRCEGNVWWAGSGYGVGDRVRIRYSVNDPNAAVIDTFSERWLIAIFLLAVGLIIEVNCIRVLVYHIRAKRVAAAKVKSNAAPVKSELPGSP